MGLQIPTRRLGTTGLTVSALSLGTVSLGIDYGLPAPDDFGRPNERDRARVLEAAVDAGINLFDTAPVYGDAERLLGRVLGRRSDCVFATKLLIPSSEFSPRHPDLKGCIQQSIEESLRRLRRDVLDIVQIHSATLSLLARGDVVDALVAARREGKIRLLGASVYTEAEALAVIQCDVFDVLQVAYNLLDRRMARRIFAAATDAGVSLILRSALLKGALTEKARWLPPELSGLRAAVEDLKQRAGSWQELTRLAFRFCLSVGEAASVLIGARTVAELEQALEAARDGILEPDVLARFTHTNLDESWLNPTDWNVP
jgi:hypothetical protein